MVRSIIFKKAWVWCVRGGVTASLLGSAAVAQAQNPAPQGAFDKTGVQPGRDYFSQLPVENVDTMSGALVLSFTDLVLPGNAGRDLRVQRNFNSKGGRMWSFGVAGMVMRVTDAHWPNGPDPARPPVLETADGGQHEAALFLKPTGLPLNESFEIAATDRFWRYDRTQRRLSMPDGSTTQFDTQGRISVWTDAFGNAVTFAWSGTTATIQQYLDTGVYRTVTLSGTTGPLALPAAMAYEGRTWTYSNTHATSPHNLTWQFTYDPNVSYRLTSMTTPMGGVVSYTYETATVPTGLLDPMTAITEVVHTRSTSGNGLTAGTWTYGYTFDSPSLMSMHSSITSAGREIYYDYGIYYGALPAGSPSVSCPDPLIQSNPLDNPAAVPYSGRTVVPRLRRVFQNQILMEAEVSCYKEVPLYGTFGAPRLPELVKRVVVRGTETTTSEITYRATNYGDFHNPETVAESGGLSRSTEKTYRHLAPSDPANVNSAPFILGLPETETVTVSGQTIAKAWGYNSSNGFRTSESVGGIVTTFTPGAWGNVASATKANGNSTNFTYSWGQVKDTTTPEYVIGRTINTDGSVATQTQGGRTTAFSYDKGRLTFTYPPGATAVQSTYAADGSWTQTTQGPASLKTWFDGFGRPIQTENSVGVRTNAQYDADGRKTHQTLPYQAGGGAPQTVFTYDALDRIVTETGPGSASRTHSYGGDAELVTEVVGAGQPNRSTEFIRKPFGSPGDTWLTRVTDAMGNQWNYGYDVTGALKSVNGPGGVQRAWTFDQTSHLLVSEYHPESGTTQYTNYDSAGVLKSKADANGTVTTYTHDGNDRVRMINAGGRITTIAYEPGTDNRRETVVDGTRSFFSYNAQGLLAYRKDSLDNKDFFTVYGYSGKGDLTDLTYPSGRHVHYDLDSEGRPTAVTRPSLNTTYANSITHHPSGALTGYAAGGITTTISLDPNRYWVSGINTNQGGFGLTYGYDDVGNVRSITDSRGGNFNWTFGYDSLDRLTSASGLAAVSHYYDAHGNRIGQGQQYVSGNPFRLSSVPGVQDPLAISYDYAGNMRTFGPVTYNYTPDHLIESTQTGGNTQVSFRYDADAWRIRKVVDATVTYSLRGPNGQVLTEQVFNGTALSANRDYIYLGSRLIAAASRDVPAGTPPDSGTPTIVPPAPFAKISPANNSQVEPLPNSQALPRVTLRWNPSVGAESYEYCVDDIIDGVCDTAWINVGANTFVELGTLGAKAWMWQVRAINAAGTVDSLQGWWGFFVIAPTPPVTYHTFGLATYNGFFMAAQNGGGSGVDSESSRIGGWETLTFEDVNGGSLEHLDTVYVRTVNDHYLRLVGLTLRADGGLSNRQAFIFHREAAGQASAGDYIRLQVAGQDLRILAVGGGGSAGFIADGSAGDFSWFRLSDVDQPVPWLLHPGQALLPNQFLRSSTGRCELWYQGDGNLVSYCDDVAVWSSDTVNGAPGQAVMQGDGNFLVYGEAGDPQWHTATNQSGSVDYYLFLDNLGNIRIYRPDRSIVCTYQNAVGSAPVCQP